MIDEHSNADSALAFLKEIHLRKGTRGGGGGCEGYNLDRRCWIAREGLGRRSAPNPASGRGR
jgi:hypothetical protein